MDDYQYDYSKINRTLYDPTVRLVKARKIFRTIEDFSSKELKGLCCLEIGCSTGMNTNFFSENFGTCIGIDIDSNALMHASSHADDHTHFVIGDAMGLPFRNEFFDIVVCNHVYEHVPDSRILMREIFRVLKNDGFCYFGAGNKFRLIEGHYHLPFLSWLPHPFADLYLKITRRGTTYYEKHLSYFQLKRLMIQFTITEYTIRIIKEPERFGAEDIIRKNSLITRIPEPFFSLVKFFIPVYIFILTKNRS
jgi:ubiquinone/menaquinone biosynthesis C-methylase UbiE